MLDGRQMRHSPHRTSLASENECDGRLSPGQGGSCSPLPKCASVVMSPYLMKTGVGDRLRPPLTATSNGGDPRTLVSSSPSALINTPNSGLKPPNAPGVSRFGFKPPSVTSVSPRRPVTAASRALANSQDMSTIKRVVAGAFSPAHVNGSGDTSGGRQIVEKRPTTRLKSTVSRTAASRTAGAPPASTLSRATRGATAGAATPATGFVANRTTRHATGYEGKSRIATRSQAGVGAGMTSNGNSRRVSTEKKSEPIAVSGRTTRTATKVKPKLEFSRKASIGGAPLGLASPTGRGKRSAREGAGLANRRVLKSPRTSTDQEHVLSSRVRTPNSEGRGGIRLHAQRIFTVDDEEVESILKLKVKSASKWDYKTRISNQTEVIEKFRQMLRMMQQQKHRFKEACIDTEAYLKSEMRRVNARCGDVERDHEQLLGENAKLRDMESGYKSDLEMATSDRVTLQVEAGSLRSQMDSVREERSRAQSLLIKLEARLADEKLRTEAAETQLGVTGEKLALAESRAYEALVSKEREWEARMDSATSGVYREVESLNVRVEEQEVESNALRKENEELLDKMTNLHEQLVVAEGRVREIEAILERGTVELEELKEEHRRTQASLEIKNQEMSSTVASFTISQRAADEREAELRDARRGLEERVQSLETEKADLSRDMSEKSASIASLSMETNLLREQLGAAKEEAAAAKSELVEARIKVNQASETIDLEKRGRLRAERKENEERTERTATTAQLLAMQKEYGDEKQRERAKRDELDKDTARRFQELEAEKRLFQEKLVAADERRLEAEGEIRSLKSAVEDAQSNAEQLKEMSRAQGELDVVKHRLEALAREKDMATMGASSKIDELEAKVLEGEVQRRKMHNLIQELRGNVRVFARVRPFLPSDNVGSRELPAVVSKGDGVGCTVSKRLKGPSGGEYVADTQSFSFDKCFPPSSGQEEVFTEVSEFVQSALDGFNVCLFSYGQTGSGKTHTMQGSGAGPMRGIIPRAMEQVGKYKAKLEEQGWKYEMQVSFLEIYNEQIRDLLRPDGAIKDVKHEIKRDTKGVTTVTDLTMETVDPNNSAGVEEIMQRAACHRSVGRTDMNERSSRSHSIFTLYLRASNQIQGSLLKGTLHLVDLAGSERLGRSNASGDRLKETVAINKSLTSLTDVFVSISNKNSHIPFRNSKLTYFLQPALSGDGKTLMLVNLSPTDQSYHESLCSLRFAAQVNQCELGRPKRNLRDMGVSSSASSPALLASSSTSTSTESLSSAGSSLRGSRRAGGSSTSTTSSVNSRP